MGDPVRTRAKLLSQVPVLITESQDDLARVRETLTAEIRPNGAIEDMYLDEVTQNVWEILRLGRCKTAIINSSLRTALQNVITQMLREPQSFETAVMGNAETLAHAWFRDPVSKQEVTSLLEKFGLDESAVEAEAMRLCANDLEQIDRLMRFAQARRDKALVYIAQYRGDFGNQLRRSGAKMIDCDVVVIESAQKQKRQSAA
jgi:hypothetical protein